MHGGSRFNDFVFFLEIKTSPRSDGVFNHFLTQFGQKTNWVHPKIETLSHATFNRTSSKLSETIEISAQVSTADPMST